MEAHHAGEYIVKTRILSFAFERTPVFRAEKRNKHAGVLAAHQAPSLKKWRRFRCSGKQKKLRTKYAFSIFPVSSNIFS